MSKVWTILLAAVVFVANTYCACANSTLTHRSAAVAKKVAEKPHGHCHSAPAEKQGDCHRQTPGEPDHSSHHCPHCTGTMNADAAKAKTTLPAPVLCPSLWTGVADCLTPNASSHLAATTDNTPALSLPPPTLLQLACALNN